MLDNEAMQVALEEARVAETLGEVPVGSVLVADGRIVAAGGNRRETTGDPTAHAEMMVLRAAAAGSPLPGWRLSNATLYVTLEPCVMCAGALVAARVTRLVFGASDPKGGACGSLYNVCVDPRLNHQVEITPGVMGEECAQLLSAWFAARRAR